MLRNRPRDRPRPAAGPLSAWLIGEGVGGTGDNVDAQRSDLPEPWPFDQPPNCAVFTTTHVMRDGQPITHVFHNADDHAWQFHHAGEKAVSDAMVVGLGSICRHDPTVIEVADLPPGWMATRSEVGGPWQRATPE
jgi:hypothetical protein